MTYSSIVERTQVTFGERDLLAKQARDWLAVCQAMTPTNLVVYLGTRVQAESPEDRCGEIGGCDWIDGGISTKLVARTEDGSAANASAGKRDAITGTLWSYMFCLPSKP